MCICVCVHVCNTFSTIISHRLEMQHAYWVGQKVCFTVTSYGKKTQMNFLPNPAHSFMYNHGDRVKCNRPRALGYIGTPEKRSTDWTTKVFINKGWVKVLLFRTICYTALTVVAVQSVSHVQFFPPHGLQHARLLCSPLSSRAYSNSYPLSQWALTLVTTFLESS